MSVSTQIITDAVLELRGHNVTYKGKVPTKADYSNMVTLLVNDRGKETYVRVSARKLDQALTRYGDQVVRILGMGKALEGIDEIKNSKVA